MKKGRLLVLGVVLTLFACSLVSCLDDNDSNTNIIEFVYEPILVKSNDGKAVNMVTQYGEILAPQLSKAEAGEYYLTNFLMDTTIHPYTSYGMQYKLMGADTLSVVESIEKTDFSMVQTVPMSNVSIYLLDKNAESLLKSTEQAINFICIDSTFFIRPEFSGSEKEKAHELEFFTVEGDVDSETSIPNFYLRAKSTDRDIAQMGYALNFSSLPKVMDFHYAGDREIVFNLKYKSGEDSEGKDVYTDYKHNPVKLKVN